MTNGAVAARLVLEGDNMKSVLFSEIVHAPRASGLLGKLSPLAVYGFGAAIAMPLLVLALRSYGPDAPLAAIVLPLLVLLALPLCAGTPGRLEIRTRFDARHMRQTLDGALGTLGYVQSIGAPDRLRYVRATPVSWRIRTQGIHVRVNAHSLEVIGPVPTLRALQAVLGGAPAAPALSGLETVAGGMQISDNAGRVAGMAE
jgi:hypothetical protein